MASLILVVALAALLIPIVLTVMPVFGDALLSDAGTLLSAYPAVFIFSFIAAMGLVVILLLRGKG